MALTIAGSDCSAGAGIQADCRTFERLGVYGICAVTCVVAQSPGHVSRLEPVSSELLEAQLRELEGAFPIAAAKTGLLPSPEVLERTIDFFKRHPGIPLVIDPVLRSGSGTEFVDRGLRERMTRELFSLAGLVTPNLPEAEEILGRRIETPEELREAAARLSGEFGCGALVKGGHLRNDPGTVYDAISIEGTTELLPGPRLAVPDLHGTGCTLSAAITARLARGQLLYEAITDGRNDLRSWMENHHTWDAVREVHAIGIGRAGADSDE